MASTPAPTFADLLRSHRVAAGLTQEELAAQAQLSVDAISTLERGTRRTPRKDTVILLADALNLSPDDRAAFAAAARRALTAPLADDQPESLVHDAGEAQTAAASAANNPPCSFSAFLVDTWSTARAHLIVVVALTLALLTIIGLLLPLTVPTFPRALGVIAGLAAILLAAGMVGMALARQQHPALLRQQLREMRQPVVAVTSSLLSLVVVLTTLFVTKPLPITSHGPGGYAFFSYTYHKPTHTGGSIVVGTYLDTTTVAPRAVVHVGDDWYQALWNSCLVQLPDLSLGLNGWKADQCVNVPTVANGEESVDGRTTNFRIDPRAVWSDGTPSPPETSCSPSN